MDCQNECSNYVLESISCIKRAGKTFTDTITLEESEKVTTLLRTLIREAEIFLSTAEYIEIILRGREIRDIENGKK